MEYLDIKACLESMSILIDNREQPSERAERRYKTFGCPYRKQTLDYGDYTFNFVLPDGRELYSPEVSVKPSVVIERKMSLEELSGNLAQNRKRFEKEFQKAADNKASVYLLVEDSTWKDIYAGHYKTRFRKESYIASLTAFQARYHLQIIFCPHELSGRLIKEILYRELKERLEGGVYDR